MADGLPVVTGSPPPQEVTVMTVGATSQRASAAFIQHIRETLQKAQEITQAVAEAENVADEATKFCEAIKAQHSVQPKSFALSSKPHAQAPPLAAGLTREIQTSVVWTQTMLQMCSMADSPNEIEKGTKLSFAKQSSD
mmetsp:Transcript_68357/g.164024  ORF Transcript_68357/g.164024 Transcript_68357/m.164024 type:complete len:138 (-) Transcript_68357:215-628(-)|eukprot:CAMPEP_0178421408 /NCGR_PEP_ID=MMETSP0689_2-20121128/26631_1 /TAXON_ID=160604 /ORGANISM="Amphidinium massartii, Strain CS-259" /LENGTH=137 /DNA_ID=CAMNT_0020042917 /DNA_START=96 /DNA_END=509 /DNA_ORIENTATION=+